ncbi:endo alpha-1,4 polygalactosaminidase [Streptomyces sp. TRM66268-LWL]|uniref:Endo alpha-1,4 polygalactosaminidase n=1 Tax=Streptomyces polyasparticus TaxID=2767826 RepID=A0ABR7SB29_9ACTN|nr:endo alpha-1,4 polygalactosaminidase [Streptomyces polyasparticus]MBC9712686.1 endo alpha-1,4 polygalactosaminidase [Streptomyces polyasparticus]
MSLERVLSKNKAKSLATTAALAAGAASCLLFAPSTASAGAAAVSLPPPHAGFDYQIGGAYTPPAGVRVVSRDHEAAPAPGLYNICYVNAFQAQPGAEGEWEDDLLLRDGDGEIVYDGDWGEAVLDIRTADKRERIAAKVGGWIDGCADKGFQAVEPDNYDTFTRFPDHLTANQAKAFIALLADRAHAAGLAIAQKNTAELAGAGKESGLDFAVVEECGAYNECDVFTAEYGNHVVVVEYTATGMRKACAGWGDELSIVRRDVDVSPVGSSGYLRRTC